MRVDNLYWIVFLVINFNFHWWKCARALTWLQHTWCNENFLHQICPGHKMVNNVLMEFLKDEMKIMLIQFKIRFKSPIGVSRIGVDVKGFNSFYRSSFCNPTGQAFFDPLLGYSTNSRIMDMLEQRFYAVSDFISTREWKPPRKKNVCCRDDDVHSKSAH